MHDLKLVDGDAKSQPVEIRTSVCLFTLNGVLRVDLSPSFGARAKDSVQLPRGAEDAGGGARMRVWRWPRQYLNRFRL